MLERIKKKQITGFKEFVINMETTSTEKRVQIFTAGVLEDPVYMNHVMKNIRTFNDLLSLNEDDLDKIIRSQDQILTLFAKSLFSSKELENYSIEASLPHLAARFKDELSYLKTVTPMEQDGARVYILKLARKLQMEERIHGFQWLLPPQDVYYPKVHKDGPVKIFFESKVLAVEGEILKGRRTGVWKHYYDSGKVLAEGDYLEGIKAGEWTFYYGNGNPKAQGKYKSDSKSGTWKEWDREGNLAEVTYVDGIRKN